MVEQWNDYMVMVSKSVEGSLATNGPGFSLIK